MIIKKVHVLESKRQYTGFTTVNKLSLQNEYVDGSWGPLYYAEQVVLKKPTTMCILYGWPTLDEAPTKNNCFVALRKQSRPAYSTENPYLIEIVGGGTEHEESFLAAAIRETKEEYGLDISKTVYKLGEYPLLPSPGILTEEVYFTAAQISPEQFKEIPTIIPVGDGNELESGTILFIQPLKDAINDCRSGIIKCMKVEIALRRLWDYL